MTDLTRKQQAFVEHYLICWNATEAARRAGYSPNSCRAMGSENLTKPDILAVINARLANLKMQADEVLARLTEQARGSLSDFINEAGDIDLDRARQDDKLHLLKRYKVTERKVAGKAERTIEVELYDAQAALVHLGKHLKLFTERLETTGANGGPIETNHTVDLSKLSIEQLEAIVRAASGEGSPA